MNQNHFYDETLLHLLYIFHEGLSTEDIEPFLNWKHPQNINNVISNRNNKTSYLYKNRLIEYDGASRRVCITRAGKEMIERRYSDDREA